MSERIERHAQDASFLLLLGVGIVVAVVAGSRFVPTLMDLYPSPMKALFLGLVLASRAIPFGWSSPAKSQHVG